MHQEKELPGGSEREKRAVLYLFLLHEIFEKFRTGNIHMSKSKIKQNVKTWEIDPTFILNRSTCENK
jgi:hypothetical protein